MGKSCALIPQVTNRQGEKTDSRLFKDLLSFSNNRSIAVEFYLKTKNSEFIDRFSSKLKYDENNEPTIASLLKYTDLDTFITDKDIIKGLNKELGVIDKSGNLKLYSATPETLQTLVDKADSFNSNNRLSEDYIAVVDTTSDNSSIKHTLQVKKRNKENNTQARQMSFNNNLNKRLQELLNSWGVSVGALTTLEDRLGINGVTDFSKTKEAAEGLIELIRVAKGEKGEQALPEEFAHFIIAALNNESLVTRLIRTIADNNLAASILSEEFDLYNEKYNGDTNKLAKEAAGKLVAKHLLKSEEINKSPYKSLLERVITFIKNFFQRFDNNSIRQAITDADKYASSITKDILSGTVDINITNITETEQFYQLSNSVDRNRKLVQSIIDTEIKRHKIYSARKKESKFDAIQEALIQDLEASIKQNNEIDGIYAYLQSALNTLSQLEPRILSLGSDNSLSINGKAAILRDVRNYLYSYTNVLKDIRKVVLEDKAFDKVKGEVDKMTAILANLDTQYQGVAMPLFTEFLKPFLGNNLEVPFGKHKGKVITVEKLLQVAEEDISFFDRWLDSMADSSNMLLNLFDASVKKSKELARLRTIELIKQIEAAGIKLEQAGIKDTDWMFEKDSKGNLTGNYIGKINQSLFRSNMRDMFKRLEAKYGRFPEGNAANEYQKEKRAWFAENMEKINGVNVPKVSIYGNPVYLNMTAAQKEFYDTIISIKEELDSYLPDNITDLLRTIKIRKDLLERVKAAESSSEGLKTIQESIKDKFLRRSDDTMFGTKNTVIDFENNQVMTLPIYFTNIKKGESENDISTDVVSTLSAYAAMAIDYDEMSKIINVLEIGRSLVNDNLEISKTDGNKPLVESFKHLGRYIENQVIKSKKDSRILERLDDFFEMQVYNRYMSDEGVILGQIDKAKLINQVVKLSSLNSMALNILSGISNVATGTVMMRIESMSKEFFSEADTIWADKTYAKELPGVLAEAGKRIKTNKLNLFIEKFNVLQDFETSINEIDFYKKTKMLRGCSEGTLFLFNSMGEHWMQTRTALALAHRVKMKDNKGNTVNLWDALEVEYIDKNNKALGARLVVKKGYTMEDGSLFDDNETIKFSRKTAAVNQKMHGIYNYLDRNALQKVALGRAAMQFRKWMRPSYNKRFKKGHYNIELEAWEEGYYYTIGRLLWQTAKELKERRFTLLTNFNELSETEKHNIIRAVTEVAHFLAVMAILSLGDWDDWDLKYLELTLRRLYTELGTMVPSPYLWKEGKKIMNSPAAAINTIDDTLSLIGLLNPFNYEFMGGEDAILQSGRFKGESRATKLIFDSPVIPMNQTIWRALHPDEVLEYYK